MSRLGVEVQGRRLLLAHVQGSDSNECTVREIELTDLDPIEFLARLEQLIGVVLRLLAPQIVVLVAGPHSGKFGVTAQRSRIEGVLITSCTSEGIPIEEVSATTIGKLKEARAEALTKKCAKKFRDAIFAACR